MDIAHPGSQTPSLLVILSILTGFPIALWSYKCLMMVLFQRKIIYMPYLPWGARKEKLEDVPPSYLRGIECEQVSVPSEKGVILAGILATTSGGSQLSDSETVFVYFQGNAGSPLLMIPPFQTLLTTLRPAPAATGSQPPVNPPGASSSPQPHYAILSVAPRSYWKSTRRTPTQCGITIDYLHALHYALNRFPHSSIVVFGHSLGAAAAIYLLSQIYSSERPAPTSKWKWKWHHGLPPSLTHDPKFTRIRGLVLENPFSSIPDMVHAFYPEKWLPHHYIGPLAIDKWDAATALRRCAPNTRDPNKSEKDHSVLVTLAPDALVLHSERDEMVPKQMGEMIYGLAQAAVPPPHNQSNRIGRFIVVPRAFHSTAWTKKTWADEIKRYLGQLRNAGG